ncbi:transglutaminase-like putative cysteine protease [Polymorphobacter multimanifer]|uniref:Transglutaminase-like putative cysteine protease n=2 Tax=Polymorphobacter multimanifer TaxID=1070431 RepID=A0A841LEE5_9SPHN|nr:transglutaminase family protein [Polymorphobacter multimanifer]MBB6228185.1 transglutaminase-like putative cysteine protease [Polymorphobacter multimanifer]
MQLRVGFDLQFSCPKPTELIMMLSLHPSQGSRLLSNDALTVSPALPVRSYIDSFGNRAHRLTAPAGPIRFQSDFLVQGDDSPDVLPVDAVQHPIADLPDDVLIFLLASRYCEVEKLSPMAWQQFGALPDGWPRVQAILDFVHGHIRFDYNCARGDRSAHDALTDGEGVCRDFAHLSVALCRAMHIPARYVTGWLGDIRWPRVPGPMDFSGWTQVWLGGRWWDVDARHVTPRHGRVLMAVGRDAADVAISTAFGAATVTRFHVISDEVDPPAEWLGSNHETVPFAA